MFAEFWLAPPGRVNFFALVSEGVALGYYGFRLSGEPEVSVRLTMTRFQD